jgi:outer membrane receptor protein involved in Fe transport
MQHASRLLLLSILIAAANLALAQTGKISGTITDAKTGEELIGASVRLKGTSYGAKANVSGVYVIKDVSPGNYSVEVSLVGYTPIVKTGVQVKDGQTLTLDFKMKEASVVAEEIEIIGQRPLLDIEQSASSSVISKEALGVTAARDIKEVVATQVGVTQTPFGVYIRGGRSYETGFYVDGVSAQDPLAGTGFGVDINAKALEEVEVITGGAGAEYGESPAGVIALKTKEGTNNFFTSFSHRRDNFGFQNFATPPVNPNRGPGWNTTLYDAAFSGPILRDKVFFFVSANTQFSDEFMRNPASQLRSSLASTFWSPFNDNRWSGTAKLTWKASGRDKLTFLYTHSLNINQNTQMLQITGNDVQLRPGYQFQFLLLPDNAVMYTQDSQLSAFTWGHNFSKNTLLQVQASRLFVRMRAEVSGRPFRPDFITEDLDPRAVIRQPQFFNPDSAAVFTISPDGFVNTGIGGLWHDHFVDDYVLNVQFHYNTDGGIHSYMGGFEHKSSEYQWVDILNPWVGAPLSPGEPSRRLGSASDIWAVKPWLGAFFVSDRIRYKGLVATLGARLQYWFPGDFADNAVNDPATPIPDFFRTNYIDNTGSLFGKRYQLRLLPKISIAFPIRNNQMLYLNYNHSSRLPHPRWLYRGLDSRFVNNSLTEPIGNPSLLPETTVSYELGLKNQLTENDVLVLTAFYNDRFDFIAARSLSYTDPRSNNLVTRSAFLNQDYARTRGIEASYIRRFGKLLETNFSFAYQIATGKSTSAEATVGTINRTGTATDDVEFNMAWDRPISVKGSILLTQKDDKGMFGLRWLNDFKVLVLAQYLSGLRYTAASPTPIGITPLTGRPLFQIPNDATPFGSIGTPWFWVDVSVEKNFVFAGVTSKAVLQLRNAFNNQNAAIVNPITGQAYQPDDPVLAGQRDPRFPNVGETGLPPTDPSRFAAPLQLLFGFTVDF